MATMIKNPRILIWVFFIIISLLLIAPNPNPTGVVIAFREKDSPVPLDVGDIIYKINDEVATQENIKDTYTGVIKLETSEGTKFMQANGTLGISVEGVQSTNLKFGLDLKGGVHAVIEPNASDNATIQQIISTLQTRINVYGLREAVFRSSSFEGENFIEISIAGGNENELRDLLERQGSFDGKIIFPLKTEDNKTSLNLDKEYVFTINENTLEIEGNIYNVGDDFTLAGIVFTLDDIIEKQINLTTNIFSGSDIRTVYFDPQHSRIELIDEGSYRWMFGIQISPESAQKFAWITNNLDIIPGVGRESYLNAKLVIYLDDEALDELNIVSTLKGQVETEISITGGASSIDESVIERSRLQSILRSGALPTSIEIVQLDKISPNLGSGFLKNAAIAALVAMLGVVIVVSIRYRKPKLVIPIVGVSLSEVLIILGISVLIGWTIDLPAIAGIIAAVGTGIDSQILILDNALRKEIHILTLKERLGRAFFIIFGAGGTVIAAMIPLMAIGFGMLRGFAITTIIGVLVGILITRPAYGVIVERFSRHLHSEEE